MKNRTAVDEAEKLGTPVPVRISHEQKRALDLLNGKTNISRQAIIRLGLNYFLPRFISGEIDLQECIVKERKKQAA